MQLPDDTPGHQPLEKFRIRRDGFSISSLLVSIPPVLSVGADDGSFVIFRLALADYCALVDGAVLTGQGYHHTGESAAFEP